MDIDRVRYFHVFCSTGSIIKAAEILHISQPALSKSLKVLETEVGLKLLEAEGRGVRLTESGKKFRDETQALLSEWLEIPKRIRDEKIQKSFRLTSFEVFTTYFLGHLLQFMEPEALEVHEYGPGRMEQAVADGRADIGITYLPVPMSGVEFVEVTKVKMGIFGRSHFKAEKFESLPFAIPVLPVEGTPSKVLGLDGWPDHLAERKVNFRVTMMESAMELCRAGRAVAYLPEFVIRLHNQRLIKEAQLEELKSPLGNKFRHQSVFIIRRTGAEEANFERKLAKSLRTLR